MVKTCSGSDIQLPWNFSLSHGERVEDIKWIYQAEGRADELIAVLVAGTFNPTPAFSGRVQWTGAAGIMVSKAGLLESGNYTVMVSIEYPGQRLVRIQRTASVQVVGK